MGKGRGKEEMRKEKRGRDERSKEGRNGKEGMEGKGGKGKERGPPPNFVQGPPSS